MPSANSKEKYWYRYRGYQISKDQGLLDSAMHAPVRAVGSKDLYPTFFTKQPWGISSPETILSLTGTSEPPSR